MKEEKEIEKKNFKRYILWYWGICGSVFFLIIFIFILAALGVLGKMPTFDILENPDTKFATEILSQEGKTLGKIYFSDNRTSLDYKDLSPFLVKALIATEDERFFRHAGIDLRGTLRAILFLGDKGGGSTITQQLARQLFVGVRSKNFMGAIVQKIKEWVIAIQLERSYTKEEIITMYFNIYDFNNQADGVRSAARIYYGKEPIELNVEQAATLVGMFKNSSLYNPRRNPVGVKNRRNIVLSQMYKHGLIDIKEKDSIQETPLSINFHPETHDMGTATYFREYLRSYLKQWVNKNPKPDGTKHNLYKDGLKIYTTINAEMQQYAEEAVSEHMKRLQKAFFRFHKRSYNSNAPFVNLTQEEVLYTMKLSMKRSERWRHMKYDLKKSEEEIKKSFYKPRPMVVFSWQGSKDTVMTPYDSIRYYKYFLRAGIVSIEPQTGKVRTWVGGINYRHFKYDQVYQGKRQSGSVFKPFIYATAIDQLGLSPCDKYPDVLHCIEAHKYGNQEKWCPNNAGNRFSGEMKTLKKALANSINTITATLIDKVGPEPVVKLVKKLGITTEILPVPSIALGTTDVKLIEMVAAYATFANKGIYVEPSIISRIEDKNGIALYEHIPKTRDVLSEDISYAIINLLMGVTQYGSGQRLRGNRNINSPVYRDVITGYPYDFKNEIGGKTGTSQNHSDGWFMGIVPNLATGVWVGAEDRSIHFNSIVYGQGATTALPIWGLFMKKCYGSADLNISKEKFSKPKNISIPLNCGNVSLYDELEPYDSNDPDDVKGIDF